MNTKAIFWEGVYMDIKSVNQILEWNMDCSGEVRKILDSKNVYMINFMGSPGAGKTSVIIEIIKKLKDKYNIAVVEGDIAGKIDAEKIDSIGIPVVQLNTTGACHIEAMSIKNIMEYFDLDNTDIIFIENIGNLVCPAEFDLGENLKVAVLSIPEGDDKAEKYPLMFSIADVLLLNKHDMIRYFDFDEQKLENVVKNLNSNIKVFRTSSETEEGIKELADYIESRIELKNKGLV